MRYRRILISPLRPMPRRIITRPPNDVSDNAVRMSLFFFPPRTVEANPQNILFQICRRRSNSAGNIPISVSHFPVRCCYYWQESVSQQPEILLTCGALYENDLRLEDCSAALRVHARWRGDAAAKNFREILSDWQCLPLCFRLSTVNSNPLFPFCWIMAGRKTNWGENLACESG